MAPLAGRRQPLEISLNSQTLILVPLSLLSSLPQSRHLSFPVTNTVLFQIQESRRTPEGFPLNLRSGTMSLSQKMLKAESHRMFLFVLMAWKLKAKNYASTAIVQTLVSCTFYPSFLWT